MINYIENLLRGSEEWKTAPEEIRKAFEEYLDKFFKENENNKMKVPMAFHEWLRRSKREKFLTSMTEICFRDNCSYKIAAVKAIAENGLRWSEFEELFPENYLLYKEDLELHDEIMAIAL